MLILDLMSPSELEEVINTLRKDLFDIAAVKGFSDQRAIEISNRMDLYLKRYYQIKK